MEQAQSAKKIRRTRTGCLTCRRRRIKCDERKPFCKACTRLSLECQAMPLNIDSSNWAPLLNILNRVTRLFGSKDGQLMLSSVTSKHSLVLQCRESHEYRPPATDLHTIYHPKLQMMMAQIAHRVIAGRCPQPHLVRLHIQIQAVLTL